jgi:putative ABC transport system permease protein
MSFLFEILRLGLTNLMLHKLRSVLTSLGIILGVAAVIIMVSIGEGNKQAALREIQALGATNIIVRSSKPPETATPGQEERSFIASYGLERRDLRRLQHLKDELDAEIISIVPLKAIGGEISYRARRMTSQAFGVTPELQRVANLRVEPRGRYVTQHDVDGNAPVAVIGAEIANTFFPLEDPLGKTIRIDERIFTVIGILHPVGLAGGAGSALVGRDWNKDVHIPISTADLEFGDIIMRRQAGSFSGEEVELSEIYITAASTDAVLTTAEKIRRTVAVGHPDFSDVQIIVPWELLESAKRTALVWNIVLISIAAISLLIGGIGIMNIMLASVTERTREIGIRRALGATRKHIVAQFLVETGSLSAVGGVIGIGVGVGVSVAVRHVLPWVLSLPALRDFVDGSFVVETQVTLWSIIVSFLVAALVGLGFGIYPALIASRQDPIVALRHD